MDLFYLADSQIVEELVANYYAADSSINKSASIFSDLGLDSVKNLAQSFGSKYLTGEGAGSNFSSALAAGALFKIHPILGILDTAAQLLFHFDIIDLIKKIFSFFEDKIKSGTPISPSEFDAGAKQAVGFSATASHHVHEIVKEAANDKLMDIIKLLTKGQGKKFIMALVIWLCKSFFIGAGLFAVGGFLVDKLSPKSKQPSTGTTPSTPPGQTPNQPGSPAATPEAHQPKEFLLVPSGRGDKKFPNDSRDDWVVPMTNGPDETLWAWVTDIYPTIEPYEDQVKFNPYFREAAGILEDSANNSNEIYMPKKFHSRKEFVDSFINKLTLNLG